MKYYEQNKQKTCLSKNSYSFHFSTALYLILYNQNFFQILRQTLA